MAGGKVEQPWPCLSKQGMVDLGFGVAWPAPQGLALVGPGVSELVTADLYTLEEWRDLQPVHLHRAQYAGRYVASYQVGTNIRQMLIIDKPNSRRPSRRTPTSRRLWGDPGPACSTSSSTTRSGSGMPIRRQDDLRLVLARMGAAEADKHGRGEGRCRLQHDGRRHRRGAAAYDAAKAVNAAVIASGGAKGSVNATSLNAKSLNGSLLSALPPVTWDSLNFSLYVDGKLKFSRSLKNSKPFRLPAGYKSDSFSFRVSGNVTVKAIVAAETVKGLSAI
jgi:hypothetical protein